MSDTQNQSMMISALSAQTMQEIIGALMSGGTYAANQRLARNAVTEMDEVAKRMTDEKQQIEAAAFQRGADEQRRMSAIQTQPPITIQGQPPSFLDPNGPDLTADAPK